MAEPVRTVRERFSVNEGQYLIIGDVDKGPDDDHAPNGIIRAAEDGAVIYTGLTLGDIWLRLELWDAQPPLDTNGWDDVGEVTYTATMPARPCAVDGDSPDVFPDLAFAGPGTYRIRISTLGRDAGHQADVIEAHEDPVEEHRIQVWPAPAGTDLLHKASDTIGAHLRKQQ
ncbi:hypothetical protein AB0I10_31790 [Streptomyces sp. NPDC050636]|uniref:hypothetical protein n=1 Tax=Streptomyces sp. NPDC050636 TaxID=3154510 RepID=UPI00341C0B49